jgi:cold shock CspA family protein
MLGVFAEFETNLRRERQLKVSPRQRPRRALSRVGAQYVSQGVVVVAGIVRSAHSVIVLLEHLGCRDADRNSEVVQFAKRLRIYSAARRRRKDVFVHFSAVEKAGLTGLNEGQIVQFEEVSNRGKTSAENLNLE